MEIAEKLFPSCADGPRRIGTDVFGDYLSSALPWKDVHREETVET